MSDYNIGLRVLVLNNNYMPISVFPLHTIMVEEAVTRVFNNTCHVVASYERKILTRNLEMKWPSVIARHDSKLVKERVKLSDETLFFRDEGKCQYCGDKLTMGTVTFDHVIPKSKGGKFTWDNIVSACSRCNSAKGDADPVGVWKLKRMPIKPTYHQLLNNRKKFPIIVDDINWMDYIGEWESDVIVRYP